MSLSCCAHLSKNPEQEEASRSNEEGQRRENTSVTEVCHPAAEQNPLLPA
jgi:hypothetical protein